MLMLVLFNLSKLVAREFWVDRIGSSLEGVEFCCRQLESSENLLGNKKKEKTPKNITQIIRKMQRGNRVKSTVNIYQHKKGKGSLCLDI